MADTILLYRFMTAEAGVKTIAGGAFRVGRLKQFNDPFEWRTGVINLIPGAEPFRDEAVEGFVDDANAVYGIICFSKTIEEPVLWSHYADNHRGMAFQVNCQDDGGLHKVEYTSDRTHCRC
jgi:hypothetical protein